jgi:predicted DNA-binding transcriptional regulator YafY
MFDNDEALAVTLGLLVARRYGLTRAAPATEGALAKIERVLPDVLRTQVRALAETLVLDRPEPHADAAPHPPVPSTETLLALATAAAAARRVTLAYDDRHGAPTVRPFDPYAVVCAANAAWYTVGHCHLRGDVRMFRLDRVARVEPDGTPFARPADFDALAYVRHSLALLPAPWSAEIVLDAPLADARRWIAPLCAVVTEENGAVILRCTATDLDWLARALAGLPFAFRVRTPRALRDALATVRARIEYAIATMG